MSQDNLRDDKKKKKGTRLRCLTTNSWLKNYWFNYTWKKKPLPCQAWLEYSHVSGRPPVSALSSVTLTFITTLDRELNLDCPGCVFIRCAEATVASDYRGLWLQRRDADLLKVMSCSLHSPCQQTHAVCLAGQDWQESRCRKIPLFQAWPS